MKTTKTIDRFAVSVSAALAVLTVTLLAVLLNAGFNIQVLV